MEVLHKGKSIRKKETQSHGSKAIAGRYDSRVARGIQTYCSNVRMCALSGAFFVSPKGEMYVNTAGKVTESESLLRLISACRYCESISSEPANKTPVACTKLSGASRPIQVNFNTCLGCREYTKP